MTIPSITSTPAKLADLIQTRTLKPLSDTAQVRGTSTKPAAADVKKAASQFEAIILRQLLKPSIEPMMSGGSESGPGAGGGGSVYAYMLTDTLANSLSSAGGLGLSRMLEKQFSPSTTKAAVSKPSL